MTETKNSVTNPGRFTLSRKSIVTITLGSIAIFILARLANFGFISLAYSIFYLPILLVHFFMQCTVAYYIQTNVYIPIKLSLFSNLFFVASSIITPDQGDGNLYAVFGTIRPAPMLMMFVGLLLFFFSYINVNFSFSFGSYVG